MPNRPVHLAAGVATGAVVSGLRALYWEPEATLATSPIGSLSLLSIVLIGAAVGGQFGLLPDILEPSKKKHWRHRRFFHSYTVMLLLVLFFLKTESNPALHDLVQHFFTVAIAGYLSHLLLDSRTPSGLPWI